jgi:hypothetical protein
MATTYSEIYVKFLRRITDYSLNNYTDGQLDTLLLGYLSDAIDEFSTYTETDLDDRDDETESFGITLTVLEKDLLSFYMLKKWLENKTFSEENIKNTLGTRDYKIYSPANLVDKLQNLNIFVENRINNMLRVYQEKNNE